MHTGGHLRRGRLTVGLVSAAVILVGFVAVGARGQRGSPATAHDLAHRPAAAATTTRATQLAPPATDDVGAATGTAAVPTTSHSHMTVRFSSPSDPGPTLTIESDSDPVNHRSTMTESGESLDRDIRMITDGDVVYLGRSDGSWAKVELGSAIRDKVISQLGAVTSELSALQRIGGDLHPDGQARVDGVATNRWTGPLDMARFLKAGVVIAGQSLDPSILAETAKASSGRAAAYLDGDRRLRRMTINVTIHPKGRPPVHIDEDLHVTRFGEPVQIDVPAAGDITRRERVTSTAEFFTLVQQELGSQTA